ncbi:MAG TPA: clostripain-related cysteine peptidase [Pyrinomonadaceae bacterium]
MKIIPNARAASVLALMFACLLALSSPPVTDARMKVAPAGQTLPEWTVMVFMDGDNNLEPFALSDFEEMARVSDSSQVNVVVQLDRIDGWSRDYDDWKHTLRFKVRHKMTPTPANALSPSESGLAAGQELNMGHPDTLSSFVSWARNKYPAKRYLLVIWDHGDGWRKLHTVSAQQEIPAQTRLLRAVEAAADDAAADKAAANNPASKSFRKSRRRTRTQEVARVPVTSLLDATHRAISMDDTDRDRLYMREVQSTLESSIGNQRLDIIGFDACLMAMVENGFAMRRVADVMVGSEELEPGDGWQYDDWLPQLISNPTMDARALGSVLVESYKKTYTTDPEKMTPRTTLSAIDLSQGKMAALAQVVSDLGDELIASLDTELSNIRIARESCKAYAPGDGYHGIDLQRFVEQLAARTTRPSLRDRAQAVLQMLNGTSLIVNNYAGAARQGDFGSRGIAIYFPKSKTLYASDPYGDAYHDDNRDYEVEFVTQHKWDNFLHAFFARVP